MWKNGQNEAEHSTWMLLLTEKTVHRWWSELSVAPPGQLMMLHEVPGEYVHVRRQRTAAERSGTPPWTMEAPVRKYRKPECIINYCSLQMLLLYLLCRSHGSSCCCAQVFVKSGQWNLGLWAEPELSVERPEPLTVDTD